MPPTTSPYPRALGIFGVSLSRMGPPLDTHPDADVVQLQLYRGMRGSERARLAHEMSLDARATSVAAIRSRHPDYDEDITRWALFRLLVGDELFCKAWPAAPLVAP